jgi:CMP-N-acetylneuraminic acid synthetase/spore coat polysaccharide biosynthesis predicted glycosyltransferase SpsG
MEHVDIWALIPARGGSVGVPRKNLRVIGGAPLIVRTIATALSVLREGHVVVITDDHEIEAISREAGAVVIFENQPTPPGETLDTKILRNLAVLKEMGARDEDIILTLQPTSPLLPSSAITQAVEALSSDQYASVLSVTDSRHLEWVITDDGTYVPAYTDRVNRQELPARFRETGGVIGSRLGEIEKSGTRVIAPTSLIELSAEEGIDVDTFADLYAAGHLLTKLKVFIRTDAAPALGMGHVYRSLAVATELARHNVQIFTHADMPLGAKFFEQYPYRHCTINSDEDFINRIAAELPDLVILDILDTDAPFMYAIRGAAPQVKIVTFEDAGTGAEISDLAISEFVPIPINLTNVLTGIDNAILAPSFDLSERSDEFRTVVGNVVVLFGGTDPSGLAGRSLDSLQRVGYEGTVTVVRGLGASPIDLGEYRFDVSLLHHVAFMPGILKHADFAFTSAGRTIIELAQMGVPSIGLAQNIKELSHTHAVASNGVDMLGLGKEVDDETLDAATRRMLTDTKYRRHMRQSAINALRGRSNRRTLGRIFDLLGFDPFPNL